MAVGASRSAAIAASTGGTSAGTAIPRSGTGRATAYTSTVTNNTPAPACHQMSSLIHR